MRQNARWVLERGGEGRCSLRPGCLLHVVGNAPGSTRCRCTAGCGCCDLPQQIKCGDKYADKAVETFTACAISEQKCVPQRVDEGKPSWGGRLGASSRRLRVVSAWPVGKARVWRGQEACPACGSARVRRAPHTRAFRRLQGCSRCPPTARWTTPSTCHPSRVAGTSRVRGAPGVAPPLPDRPYRCPGLPGFGSAWCSPLYCPELAFGTLHCLAPQANACPPLPALPPQLGSTHCLTLSTARSTSSPVPSQARSAGSWRSASPICPCRFPVLCRAARITLSTHTHTHLAPPPPSHTPTACRQGVCQDQLAHPLHGPADGRPRLHRPLRHAALCAGNIKGGGVCMRGRRCVCLEMTHYRWRRHGDMWE